MIKSKRDRSPWWLLLLVLVAIIATGIDCDAGTLGKPVKHLSGRDALRAVVAVALCRPETEVPANVRVELVEVKGRMTYRTVKQVDPVKKTEEIKK